MKKNIIYIVLTFIIMGSIFYGSVSYVNSKKEVLDDNYIAIFKGEFNSCYVYTRMVKKKGKAIDVVFKYINTETKSNFFDDTYSEEIVLKKSNAKNIDDLFDKANKNNSYNYVYLVSENKTLSIDEFKLYLENKEVDTYE